MGVERPLRAAARLATLSVLCALVPLLAAAGNATASVSDTSYVVADGQTGDPVSGGGKHEWWPQRGDAISLTGTSSGLTVTTKASGASVTWTFNFGPVDGDALTIGTYADAADFVTGHPQMRITHNGSAPDCNFRAGRFVVHDIGFAADGTVNRIDLTYEQRCDSGEAALVGTVSVNEPESDPSMLVMPNTIDMPDSYRDAPDDTARLRFVNTSGTLLHTSATSIGGTDVADFYLKSDGCSGLTLAPAASCAVVVAFHPPVDLSTRVTVTVLEHDDSPSATHSVAITGALATGYTSFEAEGEPGSRMGPQKVTYRPPATNIHVIGTQEHVEVDVLVRGIQDFTSTFTSPSGTNLVPGTTYTNAMRDGYQSPPSPGMDASLGCNTLTGSFTIHEYALDPTTGRPTALSLTWKEICGGETAYDYGSIAWHATLPAASSGGPGTPTDTDPPRKVTGLQLHGGLRQARLAWTPPTDLDFARTVIRRVVGSTPPAGLGNGTLVYAGSGSEVVDEGIRTGRDYAYSVWTQDTNGNTQAPSHAYIHGTFTRLLSPAVVAWRRPFNVLIQPFVVDDGSRPCRQLPAELLARHKKTDAWRRLAWVRPDASHHYRLLIDVTIGHAIYLAGRFPGCAGSHALGFTGSTSAPVHVRVAPYLRGTYTGAIDAGDVETFAGHISPNLSGERIFVQRLVDGRWVKVRSQLLSDHSWFHISLRIKSSGTRYYRIYKPARDGLAALRTAPIQILVS